MKALRTITDHPPASLLNPARPYISAAATDLRARFTRERKAMGLPKPKPAPQPARTR